MHRSKLDIGDADAGAGGMSIRSSSGGAGRVRHTHAVFVGPFQGLRERSPARYVSRTSRQWRAARWPSHPPRGTSSLRARN